MALFGAMEDRIKNGIDINDIAKMASENLTELMNTIDACNGCMYLKMKQCNGI